MTDEPKLVGCIGTALQGRYKVLIVDSNDQVVWEQPEWKNNLILNQGMERIAVDYVANCWTWAILGTGTRANSIDSAGDTAAQVGTTVTNAGGINFSTQAVVGDMIKFTSGEESRIISITSPTIVEVTPSQAVSSTTYVIWKTAQVGLQTETKRSSTVLNGSCGTVSVGNQFVMTRTWDFSAETGTITYNEAGVGWGASLATTVFSRFLLSPSVTLSTNQRIRLVYQQIRYVTPAASVSKTLPVGGWPVAPATTTDGVEGIQSVLITTVNSGGSSTGLGALDPGTAFGEFGYYSGGGACVALSTDSQPLSPFGSAVNRTTGYFHSTNGFPGGMFAVAYVPLSFTIQKGCTWAVADAVSTGLRSLLWGYATGSSGPIYGQYQGFVFLFNEAQTKTNTQTLTFLWTFTWSRVLA